MLARCGVILLLMAAVCPGVAMADWKADLRTRLIRDMGFTAFERASFKESLVGNSDNEAVRVTKPGTIYALAKPGLVVVSKTLFIPTSTVVNGEFEGAGGRRRGLDRILKAGETVYLTALDVKDNEIAFGLLTTEFYEYVQQGSTDQYQMRGNIAFKFPSGALGSATYETIRATIAAFLRPAGGSGPPEPKTIELGQTVEQVERMFGKPETIAKIGDKLLYGYKTMKVVFVSGKVSDVQ